VDSGDDAETIAIKVGGGLAGLLDPYQRHCR
jgi:hypothetical protein